MKKNPKFLIGGLIGVVVVVAAYFAGNVGLFQGKAFLGKNVTRGELANILLETMPWDIPVGGPNAGCFEDTIGHKYEAAICFWKNAGMFDKFSSNHFGPETYIMRAEAAQFLVEVYDYATGSDKKASITSSGDVQVQVYVDVQDDTKWHESIEKAAALGVLDIKPYKGHRFLPNNLLSTRHAKSWANKLKEVL